MAASKRLRSNETKWYFVDNGANEIYVYSNDRPIKRDGKNLGQVLNISPAKSDTKDEKLKIECSLGAAGLVVTLFDYTANDFSKLFKSFCYSAKRFIECFLDLTENQDRETIPAERTETTCGEEPANPTKAGSEETSTPVTSVQKNTKRRGATASSESPPVPKKVPRKANENSDKAEEDNAPDVQFLEDINKYAVPGLHKVLATSLAPPRSEYTLRTLDELHVQSLKEELLTRPLSCGKPIFVIAKGLRDVSMFDEKDLDSYRLEVIGGNHRREAIRQILASAASNEVKERYKFVYVQIYAEMETVEALRLAQIHNNTDKVHHELNTKEKVVLCNQMLKQCFKGEKSSEWRKTCARIVGDEIPKMETILFLSALPDELFNLVLQVIQKYGRMEIKGQRATKKNLKAGLKCTIDCPCYNFRCLRGDLTKEEIAVLLNDLLDGKTTFPDLKQEASRIKDIKGVQRQFIEKTGSKNWEEVVKRFPEWVDEEKINAFRGHDKGKESSDAFKNYITRALKWEEESSAGSTIAATQESSNEVRIFAPSGKEISVFLSCSDVQKLNNSVLMKEAPNFIGSSLIFLDFPKDWDEEKTEKFFRNMRSVNTRNSVDSFNVVVFPWRNRVIEFLQLVPKVAKNTGMTVELGYSHYPEKATRGQDTSGMTKEMFPFVVCHSGEKRVERRSSNAFIFTSENVQKDLSRGAKFSREKPLALYKRLISLYGRPDSWILDLCNGTGSAATACIEFAPSYNCIVVDRNQERIREIRRRLTAERN